MSAGCTVAELAKIRAYVGSDQVITDQEISDIWRDLEATTADQVSLYVLQVRLADLMNRPTQWSLSGDYNENWSLNVTTIRGQIAELEARLAGAPIVGAPVVDDTSVGELRRYGYNRIRS